LEPDRAKRLNQELMRSIDEITSPRPVIAPGASWQTDQSLHRLSEFSAFVEIINFATEKILKFLEIDYQGFEITGCWANMNPKGAGHKAHSHGNNYLSGVYYVRTPEGADTITFHDPRIQVEQISPKVVRRNEHNSNAHTMKVKEGRLLMFPAWFGHSVAPNPSDELRVSVSFNIMFTAFSETMSPPRWEGLPVGGNKPPG
ncbi:MAG: TIGR02466 family protein, partial [Gammaproteobacteria bacterium]|nr:TIGR02466 family protein [Gammaproteobacteria bacterium]